MNKQGQTPDEKFLVQVYKAASLKGDPQGVVDIRKVAKSLGQKEIATKNIIKHLAQANFVMKEGEHSLSLTKRGVDLASKLAD
jgi:Mn-dependent DtxR family transcriptional regulator